MSYFNEINLSEHKYTLTIHLFSFIFNIKLSFPVKKSKKLTKIVNLYYRNFVIITIN